MESWEAIINAKPKLFDGVRRLYESITLTH